MSKRFRQLAPFLPALLLGPAVCLWWASMTRIAALTFGMTFSPQLAEAHDSVQAELDALLDPLMLATKVAFAAAVFGCVVGILRAATMEAAAPLALRWRTPLLHSIAFALAGSTAGLALLMPKTPLDLRVPTMVILPSL